jgi:putative acetyltransferase
MKNYEIRKAKLAEMGDVAKVFRTSFDATYPNFPKLRSPDDDLKYFANDVFHNNDVYIAAESTSGKVLGFIAFNHDFVQHLYLLPEAQGTGMGSDLLKTAMVHSTSLKLWTFQENRKALAFYQRHGFGIIKETNGDENEEKQPDVLLGWS